MLIKATEELIMYLKYVRRFIKKFKILVTCKTSLFFVTLACLEIILYVYCRQIYHHTLNTVLGECLLLTVLNYK